MAANLRTGEQMTSVSLARKSRWWDAFYRSTRDSGILSWSLANRLFRWRKLREQAWLDGGVWASDDMYAAILGKEPIDISDRWNERKDPAQ